MKNFKNRRQNFSSNSYQRLVHPVSFNGPSGTINANQLDLLTDRPCRLRSVQFQYIQEDVPAVWSVATYDVNNEITVRSRPVISGTVARNGSLKVPPSTDFGIYGPDESVIEIKQTGGGSQAKVIMAMTALVEYKLPNATPN